MRPHGCQGEGEATGWHACVKKAQGQAQSAEWCEKATVIRLTMCTADVVLQEREREQMHQQMQRQKQEFLDRQSAAAANRRRAEEQMRGGVQIQPDYQQDGAAADEVQIAVAAPRHRKPWSPPRVDDEPERPINGGREQYGHPAVAVAAGGVRRASDVEQPVGGRRAAAAAVVASSGDELSAQQR